MTASATSKLFSTAATTTAKRVAPRGTQNWKHTPPVLQNAAAAAAATPANRTVTVDPKHDLPMGQWSPAEIRAAAKDSAMLTWMPGNARDGLPLVSHGQGVYLYDQEDTSKSYLDWTSQAVCTNTGYDLPTTVIEAITDQLQTMPFVYGGLAMTEIRARLCNLLSESVLPGDLQGMVFPSSGAEANEAAYAMARRYTGRSKILTWYRSYHGGTANSLQATGDFRRWYGRDAVPNFIKVPHPYPLFYDLHGSTEAERTQTALSMLEEQVLNEGPDTVAMLSFESIVGSGGVLVPPEGYMQGVRAICDKYGIVMHCDEVMVGFGRTGQMFGFEHFQGVIPDIISCAKGITSSAIPMSMTACRAPIKEFFDKQPVGWGSTYQAHPVAMRCAYEQIKWMLREDIVGHVQELAPLFADEMERVASNHPSIKQYRAIGLFGCFDVENPDGTVPQLQHAPVHDAFVQYKKAYNGAGLIGLLRPPLLHVAPPLVISKDELLDGFERQDKALDTLDEALGF